MDNFEKLVRMLNEGNGHLRDAARGEDDADDAEYAASRCFENARAAFNATVDEHVLKMRVARCVCLDDPEMLCCPCGGSGYVLRAKGE